MKNKYKTLLLIAKLVIGLILIFAVIEISGDIQDTKQLFHLNWYQAWPILLWTLLINIIATWRWRILMVQFDIPSLPFINLLKVVIIGRLVGNSTSQIIGDMGTRSVYLTSQGISFKRGGLSIFVDKFLEVFLAIIVAVVFIVWVWRGNPTQMWYYAIFSIMLFGAGIWCLPYGFKLLIRFVPRRNFPVIPEFLLNNSRWPLALLTLGKYITVVLRFHFILQFCGIKFDYVSAFFGTVWGQLSMMLAFTPGGLGFVEAGWSGALHYFNAPPSAIPVFLIAQRLLIVTSILLLVPLVSMVEMFKNHIPQRKTAEPVNK